MIRRRAEPARSSRFWGQGRLSSEIASRPAAWVIGAVDADGGQEFAGEGSVGGVGEHANAAPVTDTPDPSVHISSRLYPILQDALTG